MKLHSAEFVFEDHKVVFDGDVIRVYGRVHLVHWELIHTKKNNWVNRSREDPDAVMGREYKPNVTDATELAQYKSRKLPRIKNKN